MRIKTLGFIIVTTIFSCTDPQLIGLEIQPESDKITLSTFDSNSPFTLSNLSIDSVRSDQTTLALLGYFNSDPFKSTTAGFTSQLSLTNNNVDFGDGANFNYAELTLVYENHYGDPNKDLNVKIKKLDEEIYIDSNYYSNRSFNTIDFDNPIEIQFNVSDSILIENAGDSILQSLVVPMNELGELIFNAGTEHLIDNATFQNFFKGLNFSVSSSQNTSASIVYFNLRDVSSKLTIYYNDSLSYDLLLGSSTARVNHFQSEESITAMPFNGVQSMGGYDLQLDFNDLQTLKELMTDKPVNRATITFKVDQGVDQSITPSHDVLSLNRQDENGERKFLLDNFEGSDHFGGTLVDGQYTFNITKYLQHLLAGDYFDSTLFLVPSGASINANQTRIDSEVELNIIYTNF